MAGSSAVDASGQGRSQAVSRRAKPKGSRKRSTSSTFASLFATIANFSSTGTSTALVPISQTSAKSRPSTALPTTNGRQATRLPASQNDLSKVMPASNGMQAKALVRRVSTPSTQLTVSTGAVSKPSPPNKLPRPDVFSFQDGESRAPSPRPRGSSSTKTVKSARQLADQDPVYSSPIPVRPVTVPSAGLSYLSDSDSEADSSEPPSPADTPSPPERRLVAPIIRHESQQDAVGRSIQPDDFHQGRRRPGSMQKLDVPPEAPIAPSPQGLSTENYPFRTASYDYFPSAASQPPFNPYPMPPGMYGALSGTSPNPYPTPPLETTQTAQNKQPNYSRYPLLNFQGLRNSHSRKPLSQSASDSKGYYPRQYAHLTQKMIERCERVIDNLEQDLVHLDRTTTGADGSPGVWHRDQLVMKLSNAVVMHHRLLDTWTKVSQLPKLTSFASTPDVRARLDGIRAGLRKDLEPYKNMPGVDMDGAISFFVNDLVQIGQSIGESANDTSGQTNTVVQARNRDGSGDKQALGYLLFGAVLVLIIMQDGLGVRSVAGGLLLLGLWKSVQSG